MFSRMSGARILGALVVLLATVLVSYTPSPAQSPAAGMSRHRHDPAIIRERHGKNATTTNWSGYAVTGANGSVTDVKGSWIVPTLTCAATDSYSSFWVGIDGFNSGTVEQIGIDADCVGGKPTYSAWFEFYPHWPSTINTVAVRPGDTISAEVSYGVKGQFTVTLTNVSWNPQQTFSISSKMPQAKLSSAEWIVEAPWSSGVLPLANFGIAEFGHRYTSQPSTCYATVNGTAGPISSFDPNVVQIDMVTGSGLLKAQTSALLRDGMSFTDLYFSPGP